MREFECLHCKTVFKKKGYCKGYTPKYCNKFCYAKSLRKPRYCPVCASHVKWTNKTFCSKWCATQVQTGKPLSEAHREGLSRAKKGKKVPHLHNEEVRKKISTALKGKPQPWNRGKNHPRYKDGGKSHHARLQAMGRVEYKEWRRKVFSRDGYRCVICERRGGRLQADHILPWADYPDQRYEVENGRTLCVECHLKTDTWGGRNK